MECGLGKLPGGNALAWDFEKARHFGKSYPLVLAGGLSPENVAAAIRSAVPHAVDVSSGVEKAPGDKDLGKVSRFIEAVRNTRKNSSNRRIF
jgi:phosphoribosylanthranilate isomerase